MDARAAHRILQRRNIGRLRKAIRIVNHSEELTFCRFSPADNPPLARVPAAGRQVTDHHVPRRLNLLALRRLESGHVQVRGHRRQAGIATRQTAFL